MIEALRSWDLELFRWINTSATHPWLDDFFVTLTDLHKVRTVAIAAVVLLLGFGIRKFGISVWRMILGLVIVVSCSDLFSYRVLKSYIVRPRPFQNEELKDQVRQLAPASGNSFPSNHAANSVAVAVILGLCFWNIRYLFYILAGLVAYSRIYVGVHYPSDVLGGAFIGYIVAKSVGRIFVIQLKYWTRSIE